MQTLGEFLGTKQYRNIHIIRPVIQCCEGKFDGVLSDGFKQYVGFTPQPAPLSVVNEFMQGVAGPASVNATSDENCVTLKSRQRSQINWFENIGQSTLERGKLLGYAWSEIEMTVCCNGEVTIGFSGSSVPSYHGYFDGMLIESYSMRRGVRAKLDGLLGLGFGTNDGLERPMWECESPHFDD